MYANVVVHLLRQAYGYDHVVDDPDMGWSRFMHGTRVASQDPGSYPRLAWGKFRSLSLTPSNSVQVSST